MKIIIPFLAMTLLLAGCGNNSTGNQGAPMNPSLNKSSSSTSEGINHSPSTETITNLPATNSNKMETNNPPATNKSPGPGVLS